MYTISCKVSSVGYREEKLVRYHRQGLLSRGLSLSIFIYQQGCLYLGGMWLAHLTALCTTATDHLCNCGQFFIKVLSLTIFSFSNVVK